jgi:GH35 family endo-1,4-beta-xylanase
MYGSVTPDSATTLNADLAQPEQVVPPLLALLERSHDGRIALRQVAAVGPGFDQAIRIEVKHRAQSPWEIQLRLPNAKSVRRGDALLASFYLRVVAAGDETGEGLAELVFERAEEPFTKSVELAVSAGEEWTRQFVRFKAEEDYAPGEAQLALRLGFKPQAIELANLEVLNYRDRVALEDLPVMRMTYRGREADAPWRREAEERIDQHRKAELEVVVQSSSGAPIGGASVRARLDRHAFSFGSELSPKAVLGQDEASQRYRQEFLRLFNAATVGTLKWPAIEGEWGPALGFTASKRTVAWAQENGLYLRGHVLVWPSFRYNPESLRLLEGEPEKLRKRILDYTKETASAFCGQLDEWDVLNEPFSEHEFMDLLGEAEMVEWFRVAREAEPKAKLFINDYAILTGGGGTTTHREHYERTIRYLLDHGAPVQGIGMQGHFGRQLTAPEDLVKLLNRYAALGLDIMVTEYDIMAEDTQAAADYTRDLMTVLFSHPSVTGFIMWGFWDGDHWKKNSPIFDAEFNMKPSGRAYEQLVLERWRTNEEGQTASDGSFRARGFQGSYTIVVEHGEKRREVQAALGRQGQRVVVRL